MYKDKEIPTTILKKFGMEKDITIDQSTWSIAIEGIRDDGYSELFNTLQEGLRWLAREHPEVDKVFHESYDGGFFFWKIEKGNIREETRLLLGEDKKGNLVLKKTCGTITYPREPDLEGNIDIPSINL